MGVSRHLMRKVCSVAVVIVFVSGCLASSPYVEQEPGSTLNLKEDSEAVLEAVATAVANAAPAVAGFWAGAWPSDRRVVVGIEGGRSLLVGPPPESYQGRVYPLGSRIGAPASRAPMIWRLPDLVVRFRFDFNIPLGSTSAFGSTVIPAVTHFDEPTLATTVFLYHEYFHWFQERAFAEAMLDTEAMFTAVETWRESSEAVEARQRASERELLKNAVLASSRAEALQHLVAYYEQIEQRAPRVLRAGEEYAERLEGSASYFAYVATVIALQLPREDLVTFVVRDLEVTFPEDVERGVEGLRNWHVYAAGVAKCMLLERLVEDWQSKIAEGSTLDSLLLDLLR